MLSCFKQSCNWSAKTFIMTRGILRWSERPCTVWASKLALAKKNPAIKIFLFAIILYTAKYLPGNWVSKSSSNCSVSYCSSILFVSYVFLFLDEFFYLELSMRCPYLLLQFDLCWADLWFEQKKIWEYHWLPYLWLTKVSFKRI